jgi:hypothetical protein
MRILPDIATLEYCCTVHDIFDQFFMATAERITWERVVDIECFVMLRLNYFERMRHAQLQRRQEATDAANRARATTVVTTVVTTAAATDIATASGTVTGVAGKKKRTRAKDDPNKAWTTEVLDPITWRNLRIAVH